MTAESHTEWRLFVDESGNFEDFDDSVAIAGLLLAEQLARGPARATRGELERQVPGFPWPWHATWLNVPLWVALVVTASAARGKRYAERFRCEVLEAARKSLEVVRRHDRSGLHRIERLVRDREEPSDHRDTLASWAQLVRNEGDGCLDIVEDYAREAGAALKRALEKLASTAEQAGFPDGAMLVLAGELQNGDALFPETPYQPHADRYLNLLRVLLQRAASLVSVLPGSHHIVPSVLGRDVFYRDVRGTGFLSDRALNALTGSLQPMVPANVTFGLAGVSRYQGDLPVELVIADLLANRLRPVLVGRSRPLREVENACRGRCGITPRLRSQSRSALAASGEAFTLVNTGLAPGWRAPELLPCRPGRRRWACEQAWEWAGAK